MKYILLAILFGILGFFAAYFTIGQIENKPAPFTMIFQSEEVTEEAISDYLEVTNQQTAIYRSVFNEKIQEIRKNLIIFSVIGACLGFIIALLIPEKQKSAKTHKKSEPVREEIIDDGVIEAEVVSRTYEEPEPTILTSPNEVQPSINSDDMTVEVDVKKQREEKQKNEKKKEAIQSWFDTYEKKEEIENDIQKKQSSPNTLQSEIKKTLIETNKPKEKSPSQSKALEQWMEEDLEQDKSFEITKDDIESRPDPEKIRRKRAINAWLGNESTPPEKHEEEKVILEREPDVIHKKPPVEEANNSSSLKQEEPPEEPGDNSDFYKFINPFGITSRDDEENK